MFWSRRTVQDGTCRPRLDDEFGATGETIEFTVADTGIGMDEQQQAEVFARYRQAAASTTRDYGGTGLGLPLSLGLCELMGGEIRLESTPGQGTEFVIRLPENVVEPQPPNTVQETSAGITS